MSLSVDMGEGGEPADVESGTGMKIVIINSLYAPYLVGGAERSVQMLAEAFVAEGATVSVISLHEGREVVREDRRGVDVWRLPLRNGYWPFDLARRSAWKRLLWHFRDIYNIRALRDIAEALAVIAPDVVHTNNLSGFSVSVWTAARRAGLPVTHTARDYYMLHPNSTLFANGAQQNEKAVAPQLWSLVKKIASRKVSAFVGISSYVRDIHLRNGFFPRAIARIVHNSVGLRAVSGIPADVPQQARVFGFLGRIDPSKGMEALLETASRAPDVEWLIAGQGRPEYVEHLTKMATPNVQFLGRQEPTVFFDEIDVLVVPSMWAEPLGRVVLEAYSHGVPVIASRLGGLIDIVDEDRTGWFFDVKEPGSLLKAVNRARLCNLKYLSEESLRRAEDFGASRIARQYLAVFSEVVADNKVSDGSIAIGLRGKE